MANVYRLLASQHIVKDFTKEPFVRPDGHKVYPNKVYSASDPNNCMVVSEHDLVAKHPNKFALVGPYVPGAVAPAAPVDQSKPLVRAELEGKTVKELRALADELEVDITGVDSKQGILDRLCQP